MTGYERSDEDYQPLAWFRGYPIYATYLLIILHVFSFVTCAVLGVILNTRGILPLLAFDTDLVVHHFAYWQFFTYAFAHPVGINFLFSMLFLYWWGWELERFLGRKVFLSLYGALLLTTPIVLLLLSAVLGTGLTYPESSLSLHFGIFIAFAVINPNVELFFGLLVKWIAWALLAVYSLIFFTELRAYPGMLPAFWANVLVAYFGVRYAGAGGGLTFLSDFWDRWFRRKPKAAAFKPRVKPRRLVESNAAASSNSAGRSSYSSGGEIHESIDPLLDKINKHGLASLTHSERAALERARVSLLRKDRGG